MLQLFYTAASIMCHNQSTEQLIATFCLRFHRFQPEEGDPRVQQVTANIHGKVDATFWTN